MKRNQSQVGKRHIFHNTRRGYYLTFSLMFLWLQSNNASSTTNTNVATQADLQPIMPHTTTNDDTSDSIKIIFSDLDGTLVHYPTRPPNKSEKNNQWLKLPPSTTGMLGIISFKTHQYIQQIRLHKNNNNNDSNICFVLISGMRTSTFLKRLPYLPKADVYCTESGGRIFYPIIEEEKATANDTEDNDIIIVQPKSFDDATKEDVKPFGIREDLEWRTMQEAVAGPYQSPPLKELIRKNTPPTNELKERDGLLWDFARYLVHKGYNLDTNGYCASFRVNRKQQPKAMSGDAFDALLDGRIQPYEGLASSLNLSCIDYYPATSGKKNCCLYLAAKLLPNKNKEASKLLLDHAVCLCDDDNDLEMAMACKHAYIPEVSSASIKEVMARHPDHFTQTGGEGVELSGTDAAEAALLLVMERLERNERSEDSPEED